MNKRVISIILLLLYLLVCCTLFSGKIQEEMTILVKGYQKISSTETGGPMRIDWRAVYTEYNEETGLYEDHLYEVLEGFGWEQGLRCRNVKGFGIDPIHGIASVTLNRDAFLVLAASRNPREGALAKIVEEFETGEDLYLYYYPGKLPPDRDFPSNVTVMGETEHAILTAVIDADFPFLPHTAKTWTTTTDYANKVYSLAEAEDFLIQLPIVIITFWVAILGILFWVCGCAAGLQHRNGIFWLNILGSCIALLVLYVILRRIDLPASLLPDVNIFDFAHYRDEYSLMLDVLQKLDMVDHSIFQHVSQVKVQCSQLLYWFAIAIICILALEVFGFTHGFQKRYKSTFRS